MTDLVPNLAIRSNGMQKRDAIHDMPRCALTYTGAAGVTQNFDQTVGFDNVAAQTLDTDGFWSQALLTRATIRTAGLYAVKAAVFFSSGAGTFRAAWVTKNATATRYAQDFRNPTGGGQATTLHVIDEITCNAGDFLELHCYQDTAGALTLTTVGGTSPSAELKLCLIST